MIASATHTDGGRTLQVCSLQVWRSHSVSRNEPSGQINAIDPDNRVVSRHQQTRLSYDELDRQSDDLARGLLSRGVKKGDRVAVSLGNNLEYAIVSVIF